MSLPVSRLVNVTVNLSALAAAARSFGVLLIAGDSNVINGLERLRSYNNISGVAADFGTSAPEYKAAAAYFGQTPKPATLMIGRWLRTATAGLNLGGILSSSQQTLSNFTSITTGSMVITIDGVVKTLTGLNFASQTNLNGVASVISTALSTSGSCVWNGQSFSVISATTGVSSIVTAATAAGSGVDVSALLQLTAGTLQSLVPGYLAETPVQCAAVFADKSPAWYGLTFAASTQPTDDQAIAVCDFIEALDLTRMYGVTIINTNVLSSAVTSDLASRMKAGGYDQSLNQYSQNPYAICSLLGRMFSVNFAANRSTITAMYKQEPGISGEELTSSQADVLKSKNCNVFVNYVNGTTIIEYGTMASGEFIDTIHGLDWFQDQVQNNCYNVLYQTATKVPQTDAGANQLTNAISASCESAVNNGLAAPGQWNGDSFGTLQTGQYLKLGYYIYVPPMASQSQADRETRKAPPFQVALKLAGAIQGLDVIVNVNR